MPVEKIVRVPVEKIVTVEVEKIVEKLVEVPVDRLVFKEVNLSLCARALSRSLSRALARSVARARSLSLANVHDVRTLAQTQTHGRVYCFACIHKCTGCRLMTSGVVCTSGPGADGNSGCSNCGKRSREGSARRKDRMARPGSPSWCVYGHCSYVCLHFCTGFCFCYQRVRERAPRSLYSEANIPHFTSRHFLVLPFTYFRVP